MPENGRNGRLRDLHSDFFRADIQGLRGIAVLVVLLYHAELGSPGGFVGVDMFFVISGYVISSLIYREVNSSSGFSLRTFYLRRAKRLLPILVLVTVVTLVSLTTFFSSFGEVQQATKVGQRSAIFSANIGLFLEDSYIGLIDNPFRHLWSLGVEEQYYILFPVLFIAFIQATKKSVRHESRAAVVFGSVATISFVFCVGFSHFGSDVLQRFAFFSMPTRMWQFMCGTLVFLLEKRVQRSGLAIGVTQIACLVGICWSVVGFGTLETFPGLWAALPTFATSGLILTSINKSMLKRFLSWRLLTILGDISYGLYLWHWPIIVIAHREFGRGVVPSVFAVVVSLLVSGLTYVAIENPMRRAQLRGVRPLLLVIASVVLVLTASEYVKQTARATEARALNPRLSDEDVRVVNGFGVRDTLLTRRKQCTEADRSVEEIVKYCSNSVNSRNSDVLLLGDSHAGAVSDGLFAAGDLLGLKVTGFFGYGCPLADTFNVTTHEICESSLRYSLNLVDQLQPRIVVVANSYVTYLTSEQPANDVFSDADLDFRSPGLGQTSAELVSQVVEKISQFRESGSKVLVLAEVPVAIMPGTKTEPEMRVHERIRGFVMDELAGAVKGNRGVTFVDASEALCGSSPTCALDRDGKLQYWHKTHLNRHGSLRLTGFWVERLRGMIE